MSFDIGTVLNEAVERLTTSAGAIVIGAFALAGIVRTVAEQDIVHAILDWMLTELQDPEFRESLGPEELETLESAEQEINAFMADLPLALGMSPEVAALVWLFAFVLALVVAAIAIDAFGHERDTLEGIGLDGAGWKVLNLLVGTIAFGILFVIGLALLVVPGLVVAVLLVFFPAAIVLDGESFVGAFGSSFGVVRENPLETLGIVVVGVVVSIAASIATTIVGIALPATATAVVGELLSAVGLAFVLALIARAYVVATGAAAPGEPSGHETA